MTNYKNLYLKYTKKINYLQNGGKITKKMIEQILDINQKEDTILQNEDFEKQPYMKRTIGDSVTDSDNTDVSEVMIYKEGEAVGENLT
jgi:hypothetical protein